MEQFNNQLGSQPMHSPKGASPIWAIILFVLVVALVGVLLWQRNTTGQQIIALQNQIIALQSQVLGGNNNQQGQNNQGATNTSCIKEGGTYLLNSGLSCCDSLKGILNGSVSDNGQCVFESGSAYQGNPRYVCVSCGNGVCGTGENKCNCPADCVSSTWNSVNPISSVSSTSSSEIAGWKTYRNDGYGYEIKYPDDWFLSEFCEGSPASSAQFCVFQKAGFSSEKKEHQLITGGVPNDDDINIHVFKKGELQGASLREAILGYATTGGDNFPILVDGITSRGLSFILYKDSTYPQSFQHAFFESPDSFYVVEYIDNGDNSAMKLNVFSRMISTFKFTK